MDIITESTWWAMGVVLVLNLLDIAAGFMAAVITRTVKSTAIREGLVHKASIWLIIIAVLALEIGSQRVAGFAIDGLATVSVCVVVAVMELVSIWENVCEANPALKDSALGKLLDSVTESSNGE